MTPTRAEIEEVLRQKLAKNFYIERALDRIAKSTYAQDSDIDSIFFDASDIIADARSLLARLEAEPALPKNCEYCGQQLLLETHTEDGVVTERFYRLPLPQDGPWLNPDKPAAPTDEEIAEAVLGRAVGVYLEVGNSQITKLHDALRAALLAVMPTIRERLGR